MPTYIPSQRQTFNIKQTHTHIHTYTCVAYYDRHFLCQGASDRNQLSFLRKHHETSSEDSHLSSFEMRSDTKRIRLYMGTLPTGPWVHVFLSSFMSTTVQGVYDFGHGHTGQKFFHVAMDLAEIVLACFANQKS